MQVDVKTHEMSKTLTQKYPYSFAIGGDYQEAILQHFEELSRVKSMGEVSLLLGEMDMIEQYAFQSFRILPKH